MMARARRAGCWIVAVAASCGGDTETHANQDSGAADAPEDVSSTDATVGPSDPGLVSCAGEVCTTPGQACCLENDGASKGCFTADAGIVGCGAPYRSCDEAADCSSAERCCEWSHNAPFHIRASVCAPACDPLGGMPQICKLDTECGGLPCVFFECKGETVGFCGALPSPEWCA